MMFNNVSLTHSEKFPVLEKILYKQLIGHWISMTYFLSIVSFVVLCIRSTFYNKVILSMLNGTEKGMMATGRRNVSRI